MYNIPEIERERIITDAENLAYTSRYYPSNNFVVLAFYSLIMGHILPTVRTAISSFKQTRRWVQEMRQGDEDRVK